MGSSLEASIVLSIVITIILVFIVTPVSILIDSYETGVDFYEEMYSSSEGQCEDGLSQEGFNTFLTGISQNYRIIYGGLHDLFLEA